MEHLNILDFSNFFSLFTAYNLAYAGISYIRIIINNRNIHFVTSIEKDVLGECDKFEKELEDLKNVNPLHAPTITNYILKVQAIKEEASDKTKIAKQYTDKANTGDNNDHSSITLTHKPIYLYFGVYSLFMILFSGYTRIVNNIINVPFMPYTIHVGNYIWAFILIFCILSLVNGFFAFIYRLENNVYYIHWFSLQKEPYQNFANKTGNILQHFIFTIFCSCAISQYFFVHYDGATQWLIAYKNSIIIFSVLLSSFPLIFLFASNFFKGTYLVIYVRKQKTKIIKIKKEVSKINQNIVASQTQHSFWHNLFK